MKIWVKIPEKPTGRSIYACLETLKRGLFEAGLDKPVIGVKINKENRTIEFEVMKGEETR